MNLEWKTSVMQKATIITKENKIEIFNSPARPFEKKLNMKRGIILALKKVI